MARVKSVLAVGDSPALARVSRHLAQEGWIHGQAPDVASALAVVHQVRPALVLVAATDDGGDDRALRTLRSDPFLAGVPLVLVGGAASEGNPVRSVADAVLCEAGETSEVLAQLEALLSASAPR